MCGIFGYIGNIERAFAEKCLNTLQHRGPDAYGIWSGGNVTLGHRRLSILDLTDSGRQPMSYANGRYYITFNGEIYNFVELRDSLVKQGYTFKSNTDTEVILAAYIEWGQRCLEMFNGMWAFAIWDNEEEILFVSRDRFGKKPFFYSYAGHNSLVFASEMKAIAPLLDRVEPNIDLIRDASKMFSYEASEQCLINGIRRLPPGSFGVYKDGRLQIHKWWNTLNNLVTVPRRYEEQVERFEELFMDACRIRMRSDVPVGTALSGGLDSSATISCMSHLDRMHKLDRGDDWQHAFVAAFPGTTVNEVDYARQVAKNINIEPVLVDIDPGKSLQNLEKYFYLFEELYITSPIPFMMLYSAIKQNGVTVTLDGHGADELFCGYSNQYLSAVPDAGINLIKVMEIIKMYFDSQYEKGGVRTALNRAMVVIRKVIKSYLWALRGHVPESLARDSHVKMTNLDNLGKRLYVDTHDTILPTLLRNYDRYSMANSVEIRMPFMDHRIVTYAFSLPWDSKIRNGFSKSIIRDAMKKYIPDSVAGRKDKIGFTSPMVEWIRGPMKEFILDMVGSQDFRHCDLIHHDHARRSINRILEDNTVTQADGMRAWSQFSPYLWEKYFLRNLHDI